MDLFIWFIRTDRELMNEWLVTILAALDVVDLPHEGVLHVVVYHVDTLPSLPAHTKVCIHLSAGERRV